MTFGYLFTILFSIATGYALSEGDTFLIFVGGSWTILSAVWHFNETEDNGNDNR